MRNRLFFSLAIIICSVFGCRDDAPAPTVKQYYSQVAHQLYTVVDVDKAQQLLTEGNEKFSADKFWQKWSERLQRDIAVIGKAAPPALELSWLANKSEIDTQTGTLVIIFWELWCPHCKREVPVLDALYQEYHPKGLQMIGLTRMSRSISSSDIKSFVTEEKVTYPIAKTGSATGQYFSVRGIPDAVVVHNGTVVWKGNPKALPTAKIALWVGE